MYTIYNIWCIYMNTTKWKIMITTCFDSGFKLKLPWKKILVFKIPRDGLGRHLLGVAQWWGGIYCCAQSRHCLWMVFDGQICGGHRRFVCFFFRKNRWFFRHCDKKSDLRIFESLVSVFNDDCLLSSFVGFVFVQSPRVEATRKQEPFFSLMQCVLFLRAHRGAGMNRRYFWSYFHIPSHGKIVYLHTYMNGWFFMVFM